MQPRPRSSYDTELLVRNLFWAWLHGEPVKSPVLSVRKIAESEGYAPSTVAEGIAAGRALEKLLSRVS